MKKIENLIILIVLLMTSCSKMENDSPIGGDFWLKMGDGSIVATSDIDYYDVSTHMIYLKEDFHILKKLRLILAV